jgi:hypothetical protein
MDQMRLEKSMYLYCFFVMEKGSFDWVYSSAKRLKTFGSPREEGF